MSKLRTEVNRLLRDVKNGDCTKMNELYEITYNHLVGIAYHYVADKSEAEDAADITFSRILKYICKFNLEQDGYNWMCRIVQNVAFDLNKKHNKEVPSDLLEATYGNIDNINDDFERYDLLRAMKQLEPLDQTLLYKRYWEDKSLQCIAEELHMGRANVAKRIKNAEGIMKEILKK